MRIFLLLIMLTFIFGCATRNIKYDRNKILKKYSAEYKIFIDNEKIDLKTVFLDKNNIQNIRIDKSAKELKITQIKPTELFEMKNLNLDSLSLGRKDWDKKKIELIIIDGIPLTDSLKNKTRIDFNAIRDFRIIKYDDSMLNTIFCRRSKGDILVITTK